MIQGQNHQASIRKGVGDGNKLYLELFERVQNSLDKQGTCSWQNSRETYRASLFNFITSFPFSMSPILNLASPLSFSSLAFYFVPPSIRIRGGEILKHGENTPQVFAGYIYSREV